MTKLYLSALFLTVVTGLCAQSGTTNLAPKNASFGINTNQDYNTSFEKMTIWSNDVSNAADWAFTNISSPAQDWFIETNPASVPNNGPVVMTTASNGYLMVDSDLAGNGATQNAYATYAGGPIDLTGQPDITLEFEQHYRTYLDERYVDVSNNGGLSWTTFTITDGTEAGGTVVSGVGSVDISAVAGDYANVSIRFHYIGEWAWHWAIDDIYIRITEPYDLSADRTAWGVTGAWDPLLTGPMRLPYYITPTAQIQPIEFCGINSNIGLNDIADATYSVDIPSAAFASTGTVNSLVGVTDTICASATFTPTSVGTFTASGTMSTTNPDTELINNTFDDFTFGVSPFLYARDNADSIVEGGISFDGQGFEAGNIFDIFADADLTTIRVGIHDSAVVGALIYVKLYIIDAAGHFVLQDQSAPYPLVDGDIGSFINLPLSAGTFALTAGESYLVTVGSDGDSGVTDDLVVMTSGHSEPETSFFYDEPQTEWSYLTATPAVQMNFNPTSSINENDKIFGMSVYPNPTNADANVSFSLNNAADVNITVTDLSGKVVYTSALGNVSAEFTEVSLSTSALSNGVYFINIVADNIASTEKLIINK